MSHEPSSQMHREWKYHEKVAPPPAPEKKPKAGPPKRVPRIRVENPGKERREKALTKLATTTEALTADERALLRELRQIDSANGVPNGTVAGGSLAKINAAKKGKR